MSKYSAPEVIKLLQDGNQRFREKGCHVLPEGFNNMDSLAVVIGCMDCRVPPEILFDQGLGRLFTIRLAGNVITPEIAESAALACRFQSLPLIVVLGHTECAAIASTHTKLHERGEVPSYLSQIEEVLKQENIHSDPLTPDVHTYIARQNASESCKRLRQHLAINEWLQSGDYQIVEALYDVEKGEVTFTPPQQ